MTPSDFVYHILMPVVLAISGVVWSLSIALAVMAFRTIKAQIAELSDKVNTLVSREFCNLKHDTQTAFMGELIKPLMDLTHSMAAGELAVLREGRIKNEERINAVENRVKALEMYGERGGQNPRTDGRDQVGE